uniref:BTB domain-containing protein n=1 Tax=Leersia perrieri TaxID=77586 RepID=A0A0D9XHB5_9ORYZ
MGALFSSNLTDAASGFHLFKINGYSATIATARSDTLRSKRLAIGGYDWEVHYTPSMAGVSNDDDDCWIAFKLVLLTPPRRSDVKASLKCRLHYYYSDQQHLRLLSSIANGGSKTQISHAFKRAGESSGWVPLCRRSSLVAMGIIMEDSFTVQCTITVITDPAHNDYTTTANNNLLSRCSSSGLSHQLDELLRRGTGSDVTLVVSSSGECFAAHKAILASRSPFFMAMFFCADMMEKDLPRVEINDDDMDAAVFRAMLAFIYTALVPELDHQQDGIIMAQHLLAAADRYGLNGLKIMCEDKLRNGATVETVATTLALAEQHGCSRLKASCIDLIAANLDAVMATEGYNHLMESSPLLMNDLLRAVRGRNS